MTPINLRQLAMNQAARIVAIDDGTELSRRLRDLGLLPGARITVIGKAPLNDPVSLRIKGYTLTLRNNEADHITVEPLGESS